MNQHATTMGAPADLARCPIMPTFAAPRVMFVRGQGTELWDNQGKRYLDFLGGLAVVALGHANPEIAEVIATQSQTLLHVSSIFATEHAAPVAMGIDRHIGRDGGPGGGQVFFCNSGAEANEVAIKLARKWAGHGRFGVITTYGSFHGRTLATLAATGQPTKHEPFAPMPEGFRHVALNDIDALEAAVDDTVAAILVESIQGEGGVNPSTAEFLTAARRIADERNLLLMIDEVQTGFCRTGKWFGFQHYGIEADVVCLAKALGNGMPIGATWARADVSSAFVPGDHGSTYSGQPMATSVARKVIEIMERDDLAARAERMGAYLSAKLEALDGVASVRGKGLMLAAELVDKAGADVYNACLDAGLVTNGITATALRLTPPLTVTEAEIDEAVGILDGVLKA
ncbi:MAG: acetylornithine/succinylornithine family transaminase [Acidimicrobiia bacterium]|nr:acetylornithine/succinylornithine family transaminase [Acidimicrobiia bacterium]